MIDDEVCFPAKEAYNLYELFHTRYSLFKQVYQHPVGKAIDFMICDALLEADPLLHISAAITSPEEYLRLTDCVLKDIEVSRDPALARARGILHRLRTRRLYKLVDTVLLPKRVDERMRKVGAGCRVGVELMMVNKHLMRACCPSRSPPRSWPRTRPRRVR